MLVHLVIHTALPRAATLVILRQVPGPHIQRSLTAWCCCQKILSCESTSYMPALLNYTDFHQALPIYRQRPSKQSPSNWQTQFGLCLEHVWHIGLCQWATFWRTGSFTWECTQKKNNSLCTSETRHKTEEVPQSTKYQWMPWNCIWTAGKSMVFWQVTNHCRYILSCGPCCCKATARNTIKSSNCF